MKVKFCQRLSQLWALSGPMAFLLLNLLLLSPASSATAPLCHSIHKKPQAQERSLVISTLQNLTDFARHYGVAFDPEFAHWDPSDLYGQEKKSLLKDSFSISKPQAQNNGVLSSVTFETKVGKKSTAHQKVRTEFALSHSLIDEPELAGETWRNSEGMRFRVMNAGSSLLVHDGNVESIKKKAEETAQQYPNQALTIEVPLDPLWAKARQAITDRQIWASSRVTDHYAATKPYLKSEDLFGLRNHDRGIPNRNEYFMLLADHGKSPLLLGPDEFQRDLMAVVRLAHLEYRSFEENFIILGGRTLREELPHEGRVWLKTRQQIRSLFDQLSVHGNLKVTELTRFNRFGNVPREVMEALMLKALKTAKDPRKQTDLFILSCDEGLVDYYHDRYNFQVLTHMEAPSPDGKAELIMYLDTRSPLYQDALEKLSRGSQKVSQQQDMAPPPVLSWTSGWGLPKNFYSSSPLERRLSAENQIRQWQDKLKTQSLPSIPGSSLRSSRPTSVARVREIAKMIGKKDLPTLSGSESAELREQMILFSQPWSEMLRVHGISIGSQDQVLILGPGTQGLSRFLTEQYSSRKIFRSWDLAEPQLDKVILLFQLTNLDRQQMTKVLHQAWLRLKHGQEMTVMEKFRFDRYDDSKRRTSSLAAVTEQMVEAYKNGSPLSEAQMATVMANEILHTQQQPEVSSQLFFQVAQEVGFIVNHYSSISDTQNQDAAFILTKP